MEKRKIQLVGQSTLTVSLPTAWVKRVSLKKGDFVTVAQENDGSLRIIEDSKTSDMKSDIYNINSDNYHGKGLIGRIILASYAKGYNKIRINSSKKISSENLQANRNAELKLMGLSIVEETPSSVMLQCSINPINFPVDLVIRRLYILFSMMLDEAIQALMDNPC